MKLQDLHEFEDFEDDEGHFDLSGAEKERFQGRTVFVTDLYDGDVYGILDTKNGYRFIVSAPMARDEFGADYGEDEVEVTDIDHSLSSEDVAFLKAWATQE